MLSAEGRNFFRLSDKSPKENEQIRQCGLRAAVVQWGGTKSPADCTVFTKLFGEFVISQWVGRQSRRPLHQVYKCLHFCRRLLKYETGGGCVWRRNMSSWCKRSGQTLPQWYADGQRRLPCEQGACRAVFRQPPDAAAGAWPCWSRTD